MAGAKDAVEVYLDQLIEDDPSASSLVAAYESNEALIQALIAARQGANITQRELAQRMGTSQSVVVHLEAGHSDLRLSTIARYAAALGKVVAWRLEDAPSSEMVWGQSHAAPNWLPATSPTETAHRASSR